MKKVRAMNWLLTDENMATLVVIAGFCLFKLFWHLLSREEHPYTPEHKGRHLLALNEVRQRPNECVQPVPTKTHRLTVKGGTEACKLIL
jgi:hypothetical protein